MVAGTFGAGLWHQQAPGSGAISPSLGLSHGHGSSSFQMSSVSFISPGTAGLNPPLNHGWATSAWCGTQRRREDRCKHSWLYFIQIKCSGGWSRSLENLFVHVHSKGWEFKLYPV